MGKERSRIFSYRIFCVSYFFYSLSAAYSSSNDRNRLIHEQADAMAQMQRESLSLPVPLKVNVKRYLLSHQNAQMSVYEQGIQKDSVIN